MLNTYEEVTMNKTSALNPHCMYLMNVDFIVKRLLIVL